MGISADRPIRGRGSSSNPPNRFEKLSLTLDEIPEADRPAPRTEFLIDHAQSIITSNDSPDIPFRKSLNPYRGCEHGCAYCYARPYHEYLGFSPGLDFESKILVKPNAPELLRAQLASSRWRPEPLAMSGITDCYQPVERKLEITRRCLEVLVEFRNPVGLITKNHLVTRDISLLKELASHEAVAVYISLTTLDAELASLLEPRASLPAHRLEAIRLLSNSNIPVGVVIAPVIAGLNDSEIPNILRSARRAGATRAHYSVLRLPLAVKSIFAAWLDSHFPERKDKILGRLRDMRAGQLNDSRFGSRMRGEGFFAEQIQRLFRLFAVREGFRTEPFTYSVRSFVNPRGHQLDLFE